LAEDNKTPYILFSGYPLHNYCGPALPTGSGATLELSLIDGFLYMGGAYLPESSESL